jgi:hypothetical protein
MPEFNVFKFTAFIQNLIKDLDAADGKQDAIIHKDYNTRLHLLNLANRVHDSEGQGESKCLENPPSDPLVRQYYDVLDEETRPEEPLSAEDELKRISTIKTQVEKFFTGVSAIYEESPKFEFQCFTDTEISQKLVFTTSLRTFKDLSDKTKEVLLGK